MLETYWFASSRLSIGLRNSGLDDRHAAMVKIGPRHRKTVARISIYGGVCYLYWSGNTQNKRIDLSKSEIHWEQCLEGCVSSRPAPCFMLFTNHMTAESSQLSVGPNG